LLFGISARAGRSSGLTKIPDIVCLRQWLDRIKGSFENPTSSIRPFGPAREKTIEPIDPCVRIRFTAGNCREEYAKSRRVIYNLR
jgi:hypothetical protein